MDLRKNGHLRTIPLTSFLGKSFTPKRVNFPNPHGPDTFPYP